MTINKDRQDAAAYADKVMEEIAALSDAEILDLAKREQGDIRTEADRIRGVMREAADAHGRARLAAAKARVAREDEVIAANVVPISLAAKRARLARIMAQHPELTAAARQGSEMSEAEIDDYLADLAELGIVDDTDGA